jgi:hypothetical protein
MNRSNKKFKPVGVVLHETATQGATAQNEFSYFNNNKVGASAHGFIDWNEDVQTIPWDEKGWHAKEPANSMFIGIEMCRPKDNDPQKKDKMIATYNASVDAFARLFFYVLKINKITLYTKLLGLGQLTGIGLSNEVPGLMPTRDWKLKNLGEECQPGRGRIQGWPHSLIHRQLRGRTPGRTAHASRRDVLCHLRHGPDSHRRPAFRLDDREGGRIAAAGTRPCRQSRGAHGRERTPPQGD